MATDELSGWLCEHVAATEYFDMVYYKSIAAALRSPEGRAVVARVHELTDAEKKLTQVRDLAEQSIELAPTAGGWVRADLLMEIAERTGDGDGRTQDH
ncbi:MAG: hypothetical protein ACRDP6_47330 [Actinoallomurus sp.]